MIETLQDIQWVDASIVTVFTVLALMGIKKLLLKLNIKWDELPEGWRHTIYRALSVVTSSVGLIAVAYLSGEVGTIQQLFLDLKEELIAVVLVANGLYMAGKKVKTGSVK